MTRTENSFQSNTDHKIEYYEPIDWDGFTFWDEKADQSIVNPDDGICDFSALITMIQQNSRDTANTGSITSTDMYRALGVPDVRESLEKMIVKNKSEWHKANNSSFGNYLKKNMYQQPEVDNIMKCIELQQFGDKVEVLKNNPEVCHYHPAMFVEQMKVIIPRVSIVNNLLQVQDKVMQAAMYQPGAGGPYNLPSPNKTWCNQSTYDIAEATGFNTAVLYNGKNRYNITANEAVKNLAAATTKGIIKEISAEEAYRLAGNGFTVISAQERNPIGHLSTVRPTTDKYDSGTGPLLANVGSANGVKSTSNAYGNNAYSNGKVKFYYDPKQTFNYDDSNVAKSME